MATSEGGGGGGDETPSLSSPRSKMKFLCSYGGKILPRPSDGHLKYVGGETRVIAIPRDINFSDLMKKMTAIFDGNMVLKYQLVPEDLDVLVSVRSDEDLKHMLDEYDRLESEGTPKLRCFLFLSNPIVVETQPFFSDPQATEQRYLEAINGIVRSNSNASARFSPTIANGNRPTFSISSACSSPKSSSPDGHTTESMARETFSWNSMMKPSRPPMHKVHSSPSLCTINNLQPPSSVVPNSKQHHIQQRHYQYQQNQLQQHHSYQSSRLPPDFSRSNAPERAPMTLSSSPSIGRADFGRSPMGPNVSQSHQSFGSRQQRGIGVRNKYGYSDEFANGCGRIERTESSQWSPRKPLWE